ncbi:MAG: Zn-dependent hydrolase [Proteobacteria bacterium]|nr:Zn-dependent hydrolase [Pseudomonadota bacterium]MDA0994359.1 Zn-dependent hydrolase [Pseudomonadota bacterium]
MKYGFTLFCLMVSPVMLAADPIETTVNGQRLNATMQHMHTFGENEEGGSDRVAYSDHNRLAYSYLFSLMQQSGLTPDIDVAGNLVGRRPGKIDGLAPIIIGSHIDTVPNGGHYDGIVGVMAGIEVASTLHEAGIELDHPLAVIVWSNEEGGKTGSRSYAGTVAERELSLPSLGDKAIGAGISHLGGHPERLGENRKRPGDVAGYVELHVEQGAILDREKISIGVVEGIVGIKRWYITIEGFANHAGTTPMDQRQDALYPAALIVAEIRQIITAEPGRQVGTVGRLDVKPGAPNVIPGEVMFSLEIRDLDMDKVTGLFEKIRASATEIAESHGTSISFDQYYESPATLTDNGIKALVQESAAALGLTTLHLPSGAGHDAQSMKDIAPLGMIFVPSKDGVSHAPTEFTSEQQITDGANVLLNTILGMDRLLR